MSAVVIHSLEFSLYKIWLSRYIHDIWMLLSLIMGILGLLVMGFFILAPKIVQIKQNLSTTDIKSKSSYAITQKIITQPVTKHLSFPARQIVLQWLHLHSYLCLLLLLLLMDTSKVNTCKLVACWFIFFFHKIKLIYVLLDSSLSF